MNPDTVLLGAEITANGVTLSRSSEDLIITLTGTDDMLRVQSYFSQDATSSYTVESVQLADGTVWDVAAVKAKVLLPTAGPDKLTGYASNDVINGAEGNDTLSGMAGDDALNGGLGTDTLYGGAGNDTLQGNEQNDTLYGDAGNDTLNGGAGNDTLSGGTGSDTYLFDKGAGSDTVSNYDSGEALGVNPDTVLLGAEISEGQIWLHRVGSDLQLTLIETNDKLTIQNWYSGSAYHLDSFDLGNGKRLVEGQVDALVSAMAAFAPPVAGQTTLPADYQTALNAIIAASWK